MVLHSALGNLPSPPTGSWSGEFSLTLIWWFPKTWIMNPKCYPMAHSGNLTPPPTGSWSRGFSLTLIQWFLKTWIMNPKCYSIAHSGNLPPPTTGSWSHGFSFGVFGCTLQRSSTYWLAVIPHIVLSTVHTASAGCFSVEANFDLVVSKNSNQESKMPNLVEALVGVEEDILK